MQSSSKARRKKPTKLRKSQGEEELRAMILATSNNNTESRQDKPPLPPLPTSYNKQLHQQLNFNNDKTYEKNLMSNKQHLNRQNNQIYSSNELEHQNRLLYQRQLSKSVGDNIQQQSKPKFNTLDSKNRLLRPLSAGDLLGKTYEELILLLIQLKRNQSQLKHQIEKLNLQMESEDKLSIIEPHKIAEHKLKYEQIKDQLIETQKQYENQFPLIDLIDNMVKFNSNSRSNLTNNAIYGYTQNNHPNSNFNNAVNLNSLSSNNVYLNSTTANNDKDNSIYLTTNENSTKAISTPYLNQIGQTTVKQHQKKRINDESDYTGNESDTNNIESTFTNRSSCTGLQLSSKLSEKQSLSINRDQSLSNRNLEIPSTSSIKKHHLNKAKNSQKSSSNTNSLIKNKTNDQLSSQATSSNTLSSVIASVKQLHNNTATNNKNSIPNIKINNKQQIATTVSINQSSTTKSMKEQQLILEEEQQILEAELERVRNFLSNSQLNVQDRLNDDLSIITTTENHFQAELENIDQEIKNLNAKKVKLIQSLKRKEEDKKSNLTQKELEDGTDLFTDDDAILSTVNDSIDLERVLDDSNLSLCTDVDDLELSKHENEFMQSLKAEHEQNLKQQEEERKKLEELKKLEENERNQLEQSINEDDDTTETTTIYKTFRLAKRKYENSKQLNKQLSIDELNKLKVRKIENILNNLMTNFISI